MKNRRRVSGGFAVTRLIHFCYGHRLLAYRGKCRHLHGHNGKIEITLRGSRLDASGMVMDFEEIKKKVQIWVDAELDHKMLLNVRDPLVRLLRARGEPVVTLKSNPTAEAIAKRIFEHARRQKLPVASVRLWETVNSCAEYGNAG